MQTGFGRFLGFKVMTLFPFDRSLFEKEIMTPEEIKWVDDYHQMVCDRLDEREMPTALRQIPI